MEFNYLKTVCLEKRILINYINIIEIIIIVIITQLYLPQFQFLDLKGGSGEVIECPIILGIVNNSLSMNDYPENIDILIPYFEKSQQTSPHTIVFCCHQ